MAENETRVVYRAIADFSALRRKIRDVRKELQDLQKDEVAQGAASEASNEKAAKSQEKFVKGANKKKVVFKETKKVIDDETTSIDKNTEALKGNAKAKKEVSDLATVRDYKKVNGVWQETAASIERNTRAVNKHRGAQASLNSELLRGISSVLGSERAMGRHAKALDKNERSYRNFLRAVSSTAKEMNVAKRAMDSAGGASNNLFRNLKRLENWRPRLIPPFVALVPIIGAVVGAINPLVSLFAAAGGAALGFASNLGSLAGAALAIPGILGGVAAGISSVIGAFGGVGGAFKAFGQMQKMRGGGGGGGGGGGPTAEERADALADAEDRVARAQRNVKRAQDRLNDARREALKNLRDLRIEVSRAGMNEERAVANLVRAREEYNNVMADPGSTRGDKLDAAVAVKEAEADLADVRAKNKENAEELQKAEKKGIKNADIVVDAQDALTDAYKEQRDALRALKKEQKGIGSGGGGGGGGINAFQQALDKLSPSARAFVLGIIAMREEWIKLRKATQEAFFSKIIDNLDEIRSLLPVLQNLWVKAAGAMGEFISKGIEMVASGPWKKDFATIADRNVALINNMGDAILFLMDGLRHLVIAAGPFTESITEGWAEGAENLRDIVKSGRETGKLASWLDKVRKRMEQWWRIVKNVGATIFNYSAAASGFGQWLTNGLEDLTEGWRNASEEARKEDSPFQKWLEDIKPTLSEVKRMIGGFFSWFADTASNTDNLKLMEDILKNINDKLGPAVGKLLQDMADTGISATFVDALSSIVTFVDDLIRLGGGETLKTFFDIVTEFFHFLSDTLDKIDPETLQAVGKALGAIAAFAFIGKFTGLTALFGWILRLVTTKGVGTFFKKLGGLAKLDKLKFKGLLGVLGRLALPIAGIGAGVIAATGTLDQLGKNQKTIDKGFKSGKYSDDNYATDMSQLNEDFSEGGLPIKAMIPGTSLISEILGLASPEAKEGFDNWLADQSHSILNWVTVDVPMFFKGMGANVGKAAGNIWSNIQSAGAWLEEQWTKLSTWFTNLPENVKNWASDIWNRIVGPGSWLNTKYTELRNWFSKLPGRVKSWAGNIWNRIKSAASWLNEKYAELRNWFIKLPGRVASWASQIWNKLPSVASWLGTQLRKIESWARNLPSKVSGWVGNLFRGVTATVQGWFNFGSSGGVAPSQPSRGSGGGRGRRAAVSTGGLIPQYLATGGTAKSKRIKKANGRMRPIGTDTIPAMLTPGEIVIKKSIVDSVGADHLLALNSGLISYTDMLNRAFASQKNSDKSKSTRSNGGGSPVSYFDGGGLVASRARNTPGTIPASSPDMGGTTIVDNSVTIENLTVNNPTPEPASDSLARSIRKTSYLNSRR